MAINPDNEFGFQFRTMTDEDIALVMEIECQAYSHPWTEGIFRDCMRVGYSCWVYEIENRVQGYGLISIAANEAHILNICIASDYRRQGHGKKLLYKLLDVAEQAKVDSVFLEVRDSNIPAIQLYEQEGFNRIGLRKAYYPADQGREDAIVFARALNIKD